MAQRLNYQVFEGLKKGELARTAFRVVKQAESRPQSFREFREWLRGEGLWNKEKTPGAMELLGVQTNPSLSLDPRAQSLLKAEDQIQQEEALFQLLRDANLLLMKVVLEALDVETGGRLHSTHELHRMLSSYVYPGEQIPLVDFQAWILWAEASQAIKMVGIRWGLGELSKAHMEWFRARDVDEILEDEAEEVEELNREQEASPPPILKVVEEKGESPLEEVTQEPSPSLKSTPSPEQPEKNVPEEQAVRAPEESKAAPEPVSSPQPPALAGSPGGEEVLRWLQGDGASWGGPSSFDSLILGIGPPMIPADQSRWLVEMGVSAVWAAQGVPEDWASAALTEFRTSGVFAAMIGRNSLDKALKDQNYFQGKPGLVRLMGALMVGARVAGRLKKTPALWNELAGEADGIRLYEKVHTELLGGAYPVGAFWWVGEARKHGVWGG